MYGSKEFDFLGLPGIFLFNPHQRSILSTIGSMVTVFH